MEWKFGNAFELGGFASPKYVPELANAYCSGGLLSSDQEKRDFLVEDASRSKASDLGESQRDCLVAGVEDVPKEASEVPKADVNSKEKG